ncbi:MAG: hypothetical protein P1U57_07675 [Oleibacter sp.]|nr:hypothetical protein [Thalassolituus sp.]
MLRFILSFGLLLSLVSHATESATFDRVNSASASALASLQSLQSDKNLVPHSHAIALSTSYSNNYPSQKKSALINTQTAEEFTLPVFIYNSKHFQSARSVEHSTTSFYLTQFEHFKIRAPPSFPL